jgi:hypothetical protein
MWGQAARRVGDGVADAVRIVVAFARAGGPVPGCLADARTA